MLGRKEWMLDVDNEAVSDVEGGWRSAGSFDLCIGLFMRRGIAVYA